MIRLFGFVSAMLGFAAIDSGNGMAGLLLLVGGLYFLCARKKPRGSSATPAAAGQQYWSRITGKTYSSYDEMKRAEDVHLANVYSDPRFR